MRIENKVAVITGGNSGIGKAIAERFYAEGAKVVVFGRNAETLAAMKSNLPSILTVQGDVTSTQDLQHLFQQTQDTFSKVDILVANSGVAERLHIRDINEEKFDWMVNINYRGLYFTVKYALDYLNPHASVILMASGSGQVTLANQSIYASTKAATIKLAQNIANDLAPEGIRVNSISPGYIKTPIFDGRIAKQPDYLEKIAATIPLRHIGKPEDIANAALFLASDEAAYITGTDILVDGGLKATSV